MEKKKIYLTDKEVGEKIDNYFNKLESTLLPLVKQGLIKALMLKTADDINLDFGEEIQEVSQIEVGTAGITIDGKTADGEFTMPDGTILTIKSGTVTKIKKPSTAEIAARLRKDMANFKAQIRAFVVRKPFKDTNRKPSGKRVPFVKPDLKRTK